MQQSIEVAREGGAGPRVSEEDRAKTVGRTSQTLNLHPIGPRILPGIEMHIRELHWMLKRICWSGQVEARTEA